MVVDPWVDELVVVTFLMSAAVLAVRVLKKGRGALAVGGAMEKCGVTCMFFGSGCGWCRSAKRCFAA